MPERGLCAHRGCLDTHPENTLPAFTEAIRLGAQMIEFDIQLTKDSVLIIMHDETVDRTTNGKGKVADLTFAEIRSMDAGIKKDSKFAGTIIPTFEETLALMPQNVWLNCHLKGGRDVGKAAAVTLIKSGRLHQAFLACGEEAADAALTVFSDILICNAENKYRTNTPNYVDVTIKRKAAFIQLLRETEGEDRSKLIGALKNNGVKINYYYAKTASELTTLFQSGIDFILTNNLSLCMEEAKKSGINPVIPAF